ncbi:MAG: hypothetical protein LBF67_07250 [Prevotellaceae bacterium]|jgi:hypothetical protein|nr:hypothetical protein [Prevotellaceae bacterium]
MKGFKGFDKDLKCRNKQYLIGKEEVEETASLCNSGMHFCENPHNIFDYYWAGDGNRFCEIEASEVSDEKEADSKRAAKRLTVKEEISVFNICKIAVATFFENFGFKDKIKSADTNNAGDGNAANAGDYGAANAGNRSAANAGDCSAANAGNYGAANAGNCGAANAGDYGAASVGSYGVAISTNGKVKGVKGSVLVLVNRDKDHHITDSAMAIVDGEIIKANTWYRLSKNGKFEEDKN